MLLILYLVFKCLLVIVILIVILRFCLSGLVVVLILGVINFGCFGVKLLRCLKFFKLFMVIL